MKRLIPILLLLPVLTVLGDSAKLGTLNRNSDVMVEGLYPVFQIWVPEGVTEVQIRASTNNFQNRFLLTEVGGGSYTFRCTGTRNGRNFYEVDEYDLQCYWDGSAWQFGYTGLSSPDNVEFPWQCTTFNHGEWTVTELNDDGKFVYRWCSTGQDADPTWGTGVVDEGAWLFFSNQRGAAPNPPEATSKSAQRLQRWFGNTGEHAVGTALTAQLLPAGTPGRFVIFQPSRTAHLLTGPDGDWMRQSNKFLQWVVQFETAAGWELHPDGSEVWSAIRPIEWRSERLELQRPR
jgi:hypothetical protein